MKRAMIVTAVASICLLWTAQMQAQTVVYQTYSPVVTYSPAPVVTYSPVVTSSVVAAPVVTSSVVAAPVVTSYSPVASTSYYQSVGSYSVTGVPLGSVTSFRPAITSYATPTVTYYAPAVTTTGTAVTSYYSPTVVAPAGSTVTVRPKVYVSGQPVRNVLRAITP